MTRASSVRTTTSAPRHQVILITDPEHAVPVRIERPRAAHHRGGAGDTTSLALPYLPANADIKPARDLWSAGELRGTTGSTNEGASRTRRSGRQRRAAPLAAYCTLQRAHAGLVPPGSARNARDGCQVPLGGRTKRSTRASVAAPPAQAAPAPQRTPPGGSRETRFTPRSSQRPRPPLTGSSAPPPWWMARSGAPGPAASFTWVDAPAAHRLASPPRLTVSRRPAPRAAAPPPGSHSQFGCAMAHQRTPPAQAASGRPHRVGAPRRGRAVCDRRLDWPPGHEPLRWILTVDRCPDLAAGLVPRLRRARRA